MKYFYDGYNYVVQLQRGEHLIKTLTQFVIDNDIKASWISGLGGAQWAELGFYDLDTQQYLWKRHDELLEITSLQGNIAWKDDAPALHIHGTFSTRDYHAIGGHVRELEIGGTCELHLHTIFENKLTRSTDPATGLNLLDL